MIHQEIELLSCERKASKAVGLAPSNWQPILQFVVQEWLLKIKVSQLIRPASYHPEATCWLVCSSVGQDSLRWLPRTPGQQEWKYRNALPLRDGRRGKAHYARGKLTVLAIGYLRAELIKCIGNGWTHQERHGKGIWWHVLRDYIMEISWDILVQTLAQGSKVLWYATALFS